MGTQQLVFQKVLIIRQNHTIPNTLTQELGIMRTAGVLWILPILSLVIGVESKGVGNSRILNGQKSDVLPYQVGLHGYIPKLGTSVIFCGGTLIAPDLVLTAKHCTTKYNITVRAGIANTQDEVESRKVPLKSIIPHDFVDLALLKIDPPFEVNDKIQPIQINDVYEDLIGKEVLISGWGKTTTTNIPKQLRSLKIKIINPERIPPLYRERVTSTEDIQMLSSKGEGACQGDSGGPAVLGGKNGLLVGVAANVVPFDKNMKLVPIFNRDEGCGKGVPNDQGHWPNHLTNYVDVFQFADWINRYTN